MGGLSIPLVAAERPVRLLVFLGAFIPRPGLSLIEQLRQEPQILAPGFAGAPGRDEEGRSFWPDEAAAVRALYHDCTPADASAAVARLRAQGRPPNVEPCPLAALPEVPCAYVLGRDDRVISPAWSRTAARERLGVRAVELPGGHSPFLARPAALADALTALLAAA
jgi:pimeloyl-ACP methyl ester carboxylesterase